MEMTELDKHHILIYKDDYKKGKPKKILTDKEKLEKSHKNFDDLYKSFVEEKERLEKKIESQRKEGLEIFEKIVDNFRSNKYILHNVDECECCERNLQNIFEILEKLDKLQELKTKEKK